MRLLYVSGTYAPGALAGSELSAHTLLREVGSRGLAKVRVLTDCRYTGGTAGRATFEGVEMTGVEHGEREPSLESELAEFQPTALLTQLIWSDVALRVGRRRGVHTVLRVPSLPARLDVGAESPSPPTALLVATEFVAREIRRRSARRPFVLPPAIDMRRVTFDAASASARFLTMFNPIDIKGGEIFRSIAQLLPERQFAAVRGWSSLRHPDGSWNEVLFQRSAESEGRQYDGWLPKDVDLSDLENVVLLEPREAVGEIYAASRLLLVPSLWPEAFGRVAVEAFASGVPVVASAVGGLEELARRAGVVVENYRDPRAWLEAIRSLDDGQIYAQCAERGRELAREEFSLDNVVSHFGRLLSEVSALEPGKLLDAP